MKDTLKHEEQSHENEGRVIVIIDNESNGGCRLSIFLLGTLAELVSVQDIQVLEESMANNIREMASSQP